MLCFIGITAPWLQGSRGSPLGHLRAKGARVVQERLSARSSCAVRAIGPVRTIGSRRTLCTLPEPSTEAHEMPPVRQITSTVAVLPAVSWMYHPSMFEAVSSPNGDPTVNVQPSVASLLSTSFAAPLRSLIVTPRHAPGDDWRENTASESGLVWFAVRDSRPNTRPDGCDWMTRGMALQKCPSGCEGGG